MRPDQQRELRRMLAKLPRLMEVLHGSLVRNGAPKGRVKVETQAEADALEDLTGKYVKPGSSISVAEIDRRLRESGFGCSLAEAVELHLDRPIVRPKEVRARQEAEWQARRSRCFQAVRDLGLGAEAFARVVTWLNGDERMLHKHLSRWKDEGIEHVRVVASVFGRLPGRGGHTVYLSELASHVAGGQHALDVRKPAGRLLYYALAYTFPETDRLAKRGSALWRTSLLTEAGVARDPVSSLVHTYGLDGHTPSLRAHRAEGRDWPLTLLNLRDLRDDVRAWQGAAFVVENPTVYAALIERLAKFDRQYHPTLVCTTGVLNLADWELLDALVRNGAHLFYSGDFDKAGLDIAVSILTRYPESASSPWRLTPVDYRSALRQDETLAPETLQRLAMHFPDLVREMAETGKPGDQEKLIAPLARDLHRFITEGITPPRRGGESGNSPAAAKVVVS